MAYEDPRAIVALAARTTSGNSGSQVARLGQNLHILVNVTAVAGSTPSLAVEVEWFDEANAGWAKASPADTFTAITTAGAVVKQFVAKAARYRVTWAITGTTPSFTFGVQDYTT